MHPDFFLALRGDKEDKDFVLLPKMEGRRGESMVSKGLSRQFFEFSFGVGKFRRVYLLLPLPNPSCFPLHVETIDKARPRALKRKQSNPTFSSLVFSRPGGWNNQGQVSALSFTSFSRPPKD